ncbi:MAG: hypothetical protein IIU58_02770 [Clostridia bacterium]|nr:hypothetical protein [Clostridia bacterium]
MNNIIKRTWNQNRMVNIEDLRGMAFQAESGGHTFEISGIDDQENVVELSGTVAGVFMRPDNADIALTGTAADGVVSVTLTEDCYAIPGRFALTIFVTSNGQKVAVYAAVGTVSRSSGGAVAGDTPADVVDLINAINEAIAEIPASYTDIMAAIAPTYSASALYSVGSYAWYNGVLYRCTTAITSGETWTAAHWETVALGTCISDLKNALSNNVEDVLCYSKYEATNTSGGITVSVLAKNKFRFTGTISGSGFSTLYKNTSKLPDWLSAGKTYRLDISGATANNKIYFEIIGFRNGSTQVSLTGRLKTNGAHLFTIPSDFVGGCYVRIGWLTDDRGTQVNETIEYNLYNAVLTGKEASEIASKSIRFEKDYNYSSCDDVEENTILFVSSSGGVLAIPDAPFVGFLHTIVLNNNIRAQIMYPYSSTDYIQYRARTTNGWGSWRTVGSAATTTIVQEVSRDTYNNSYDITVNPTITTDSNGWLQPIDTDTADETGKTDMTGAIIAMLNSNGYCHLAPGIYYVSGNIDMPENSTLEGCGDKTIIRLLSSVTSGYIVRMHTRSTVKGIRFSGAYSAPNINTWTSDIGGRKGINFIGNRDGEDTGVTPSTCTLCVIEDCRFEFLDSGFYGYNAGGGLQEGVICNNCYFYRCKAGINIDYWTEYCKFTNCVTFQCYYGCINNGGNNVFTACTFHATIGFLIDNSSGQKVNTAHGTVNGCTFNHIDNWNNPSQLGKGIAIKVLGTPNGFIFSNCQIWYGRVHIEDSEGIQITGCEIGGLGSSGYPFLEISGSGMVFVDNCLFKSMPVNAISGSAKFTNCWTYDGNAVTN